MIEQYDVQVASATATRFLNDPVLAALFRELKLHYFERWLASDSPSVREAIFAEARAFSNLGTALQAVADAGLHEDAQEELERISQ
jgi:hypothetical protein